MVNHASAQIPLGIRLNDEARFENYHIAQANQALLDALLDEPGAGFVYINAQPGHGLSHLLQALCHQQAALQLPALYLPMTELAELSPEILEGAASLAMLCIDNIEQAAGNSEWEQALFRAYNEIRESGTRLIIGGQDNPGQLAFTLPDLQSRLQAAALFQLHGLTDEDKKQLLQLRARARGMNLSPAVAEYILLRTERSLPAIMSVLDALDASSLAHQRPLSKHLVRETMAW